MKKDHRFPCVSLLSLYYAPGTSNFVSPNGRLTLSPCLFIKALALLLDQAKDYWFVASNKFLLGAKDFPLPSAKLTLRIMLL